MLSAIGEKRGQLMTGRIAQLSHGRFCGVIRTRDGQNVYFHGRDLERATYNELKIGGPVDFELIDDRVSGPRAGRVRPQGAKDGKTS
jgi:cold shock CspA family protein